MTNVLEMSEYLGDAPRRYQFIFYKLSFSVFVTVTIAQLILHYNFYCQLELGDMRCQRSP